jgi:hypothetical protein
VEGAGWHKGDGSQQQQQDDANIASPAPPKAVTREWFELPHPRFKVQGFQTPMKSQGQGYIFTQHRSTSMQSGPHFVTLPHPLPPNLGPLLTRMVPSSALSAARLSCRARSAACTASLRHSASASSNLAWQEGGWVGGCRRVCGWVGGWVGGSTGVLQVHGHKAAVLYNVNLTPCVLQGAAISKVSSQLPGHMQEQPDSCPA